MEIILDKMSLPVLVERAAETSLVLPVFYAFLECPFLPVLITSTSNYAPTLRGGSKND